MAFAVASFGGMIGGARRRPMYGRLRGVGRNLGIWFGVPALCFACVTVLALSLSRMAGLDVGAGSDDTDAGIEAESAPAEEPEAPPPAAVARELPRVLSETDAEHYGEIFTLQREGAYHYADIVIGHLEDTSLVPFVLADRYLHQRHPDYDEVAKWLRRNRSHPDAPRIYEIATRIRPRHAPAAKRPTVEHESLRGDPLPPPPHWSTKNNTSSERRRVRHIQKSLRIWLSQGKVSRSERLLHRNEVRRLFDRYELDDARESLAAAFFHIGEDKKAYKYATQVLARSAKDQPLAYWTAGLAAWRLGMTEQAAGHFERLAKRSGVSPWSQAGAAYWAARAHGRLGDTREEQHWLARAAGFPLTIYGLLARERLGIPTRFANMAPQPNKRVLKPLLHTRTGRHALALLQIGQTRRAEHELLGLRKWQSPSVTEALLALGEYTDMPAIGVKLAKRLPDAEVVARVRETVDTAFFPIPSWRIDSDTRIDRALLYAMMRQESSFYTNAVSPVGAKGLMQVMPQTAHDLATYSKFRKKRPLDRYDPATSIALGQTYLEQLMRLRGIGNDLIRVVAAYNGGPGNVRQWQRKMDIDDDPLLFVESLPSLENRLFVRRVLTNFWLYRMRLGQPAPSLAEMAKGAFPKYVPLDGTTPPLLGEASDGPAGAAPRAVARRDG